MFYEALVLAALSLPSVAGIIIAIRSRKPMAKSRQCSESATALPPATGALPAGVTVITMSGDVKIKVPHRGET